MDERKKRKYGGIFWLIDDQVLAVPYFEGADIGLAKSGENYNHRLMWDHVKPMGCNKEYNYYPRGRIEIDSRGRARAFMSPHIDQKYLPKILAAFGISEISRIHYDGSRHYKCYLDRESGPPENGKTRKQKGRNKEG